MLYAGRAYNGGGFVDDILLMFRSHFDLNFGSQIIDIGRVGAGEDQDFIDGVDMRAASRATEPQTGLALNAPTKI